MTGTGHSNLSTLEEEKWWRFMGWDGLIDDLEEHKPEVYNAIPEPLWKLLHEVYCRGWTNGRQFTRNISLQKKRNS